MSKTNDQTTKTKQNEKKTNEFIQIVFDEHLRQITI